MLQGSSQAKALFVWISWPAMLKYLFYSAKLASGDSLNCWDWASSSLPASILMKSLCRQEYMDFDCQIPSFASPSQITKKWGEKKCLGLMFSYSHNGGGRVEKREERNRTRKIFTFISQPLWKKRCRHLAHISGKDNSFTIKYISCQ